MLFPHAIQEPRRAQIAYPKLNVKLIGGYAGLSDFADGASHQSVEDIALMRALPNLTVLVPADANDTRRALRAAIGHEGPVYIRISREAVPERIGPERPFAIGAGAVLRDGSDVTLIGTGLGVALAWQAAEQLAARDLSPRVIDLHTVKPLDRDLIRRAAQATGAIVTVEEHSTIGGLGSAVCEAVCETHPVPVVRVGIPDRFGESGRYPEILERAGLDVDHVVAAALRALSAKRSPK
jgi:transketolase